MTKKIDNEYEIYTRSQRAERTQLYREYLNDAKTHLFNETFKEWLSFNGWVPLSEKQKAKERGFI